MAAYGLRVCPVLLPLGFSFGCQYLGLFALNVALINTLFLRRLTREFTRGEATLPPGALRTMPRRCFRAYLAAYGVTVTELLFILRWRDAPLNSRGPEVLALVALLLATLQHYGTAWAVLAAPGDETPAPPLPATTSRTRWLRGALRVTVPSLIVATMGVHFLWRSTSLARVLGHGSTVTADPVDLMPLLVFLLVWQAAAMAFYAAAEVDFGTRAARHLQAVGRQDFQHRTGVFGWGYWPELFRAMNQLSQGLLERARLLKGFSSFVSNRVVADVLRQEPRFGGKREELTVLMTDLRDFTTLAETLPPEDVVRLLNLYFSAMIEELAHEGVTVDKFIGDGLLAYVETEGSPASTSDECRRAVSAAMAMTRRLTQVNEMLGQLDLPSLRLGVGVTRGTLVQGNIGSPERMQYTVIGDSVNLAARLEGLGKELGATVVLEQAVWSRLPKEMQAQFRERGLHAVKGRKEKVRVYTW
jgi:class 3 adenylate cyclase